MFVTFIDQLQRNGIISLTVFMIYSIVIYVTCYKYYAVKNTIDRFIWL